jgi:RimJ/RimL family protein N-acetyltransferase
MNTQATDPNPPASPAHDPSIASVDTPAPSKSAAVPWIPIRSLSPRHRPRILAHLQGLDDRDRYLRFGFQANDAQIARYVDGLDFDLDEVFGVFNRRLAVVALAHLAFPRPGQPATLGAEFGGSVSSHLRGRGYGARLFEHAMLHARNRGVDTLYIHALSENTAMLRIARRAGARVERDGGESDAFLRLPPDTLASQVEAWVDAGAAEIDYRMKHGALEVDALFDKLSGSVQGADPKGH